MRVVLGLAVAALVALVVALVSGSTLAAILVVILAAAGMVLLLRDWRAAGSAAPDGGDADGESAPARALTADDLSPDLSTEPDGPSSDARADQV